MVRKAVKEARFKLGKDGSEVRTGGRGRSGLTSVITSNDSDA
jgi:hypothetical protein